MPVVREAIRGPAVLVFLLLAFAAFLTGCDITIEDPQGAQDNAQREAVSPSVAELPAYDVAVSAIDFDPPLSRETLLNPRNTVKLLAAVENKGTVAQGSVVVEARVTNQKGEFMAQDRTVIYSLSPGETKLVEFSGVAPETPLPRSPSYQITVSLTGPRYDSNRENNTRAVIVRVVD